MEKSKVKHIFFDLDNTLWDHRGNSELTLQKMFQEYQIEAKYGFTFDEWHPVFYDKNELLWEQIREGHIKKVELRERRFKDPFLTFGVNDSIMSAEWENIYLERMGKMSGTVAGAADLLAYLKPKYHIHVITNGFEEVSSQKIANSELNGYIQTLTCADELNLRKPDPRLFELAMNKAGAKPQESLIIGDDWIADIIGGLGVGWQAIFFDSLNDGNALENVPSVLHLSQIKELL